MPVNAGQFAQYLIASAAGTLTEVSAYITAGDPHRASMDTNLTAFNAGGNPVTETHIRGAAQSEWPLKGLFDPVYAKLLRQTIAARSGVAVQVKSGANQIPGQADELYAATMCPIAYTLTYRTGAVATIDTDLKTADGASQPQFTPI